MMVGIRVNRLELDEAWSFVGKKQKNLKRNVLFAKGDQYVFVAMDGTQKAILQRWRAYAHLPYRSHSVESAARWIG